MAATCESEVLATLRSRDSMNRPRVPTRIEMRSMPKTPQKYNNYVIAYEA